MRRFANPMASAMAFVVALLLAAPPPTAAEAPSTAWTVETDSLCPVSGMGSWWAVATTDDGRHLALADGGPLRLPAKQWIIRDGLLDELHFHEVSELVFNPGGTRLATVGRIKKQWFVDVDGTASPPYDLVLVGTLAFSADGQRFAYGVKQGRSCSMIIDGRPDGSWKDIGVLRACFSPDGRRLAYAAKSDRGAVVVVDGIVHPAGDGVLELGIGFSPDSRRVAWAIQIGRNQCMVVDGVKGPESDGIAVAPGVFDRQSGQLIYGAKRGDEWVIRVEDRDSLRVPGEIVAAAGVRLSPAGDRLACVVRQGRRLHVTVDGQPWGEEFDDMHLGDLVFSSNGSNLACLVRAGKESWVLLDGKLQLRASCQEAGNLKFSADGNHLAWLAKEKGKWAVMLDGQRGPSFDHIFGVSLARVVQQSTTLVPAPQACASAPTFGTDGAIEYFAANAGTLYRIRHSPRPPAQ